MVSWQRLAFSSASHPNPLCTHPPPPQPALCLGAGWRLALLLGLGSAASSALLRIMLAVQHESLVYVRLLGVQLTTRRRCGLWSGSRFLPLRQLQGIIIHEASAAGRLPPCARPLCCHAQQRGHGVWGARCGLVLGSQQHVAACPAVLPNSVSVQA